MATVRGSSSVRYGHFLVDINIKELPASPLLYVRTYSNLRDSTGLLICDGLNDGKSDPMSNISSVGQPLANDCSLVLGFIFS